MGQPKLKRSPMFAVALVILCLLPAWAMDAKGLDVAGAWASFPRQARPIAAAPASAPSRAAPAAITGPFLPIIVTSTRVAPIVFTGSATPDCQGTTGTSFTYGIKYLCADVIVDGAQGQEYRFRWTINGKLYADNELGAFGTVSWQLADIPDSICYGPEGACGSTIPRGTYQVSFFLNNVQYQTATAVIR